MIHVDETVSKRLGELAVRSDKTGITQLTDFLSPAEQKEAEIWAKKAGVLFFSQGGMPQAERRVAAFAPDECQPPWPIACVRVQWSARSAPPGHRDILGTLLGLGIDREIIGDILPGEREAHVFVLARMAAYIAANMQRAGKTPVECEVLDRPPALAASAGIPMDITVASLRLDAVLAATLHLARGKAASLIASGRVQVDHREELRADRQLAQDMVLSIRGIGRVVVGPIKGTTKKGRIAMNVLRF